MTTSQVFVLVTSTYGSPTLLYILGIKGILSEEGKILSIRLNCDSITCMHSTGSCVEFVC